MSPAAERRSLETIQSAGESVLSAPKGGPAPGRVRPTLGVDGGLVICSAPCLARLIARDTVTVPRPTYAAMPRSQPRAFRQS